MNDFLDRQRARARRAWTKVRAMSRDPHERKVLWALIALGLGACTVGSGTAAWTLACVGTCPDAEDIATFAPQQASLVLDAKGGLLGSFHRERRTVVPVDSLPPHVSQAFVAIEDRRFYGHGGVDPRRMVGAVIDNFREGFGASGGSTITMQLARNLFPRQLPMGEKTLRRKLAEVRLAVEMENRFSKPKILELYLNHIYLGAGAYGIEAAARTYYNKPAAQLSIAEAATLAGLPKAPSYYNPRRNPDAALMRRSLVLAAMADVGVITPEQAAAAQAAPLGLTPPRGAVRAPYYVEEVRKELEDQFGELLYTGGLRIHTALEPKLQTAAERSLEEHLRQIEQGLYGPYPHITYDSFTAKLGGEKTAVHTTPYLQGIAVVVNPGTGYVQALVGGRDFRHSQFNRATQALRQPGSAFKPFVYAAALEKGRSPLYRVSDGPIHIAGWSPRNYNGRYGGPTTLRTALRYSKNMVAIRLGLQVGIKSVRDVAQRTGLETPLSRYAPVYIGASAVYPLDLIGAYAAFANGGYRVEPRFVVRVDDNQGRVLWQPSQYPRPALDPGTSWILTDMLREVVDEGSGWQGIRNPEMGGLSYTIPAAGKTGTTNGSTDAWFVGYTPDVLAGVWVGLDNPRTIITGGTGGGIAAPVWARVVRTAYEGRPPPPAWPRPPAVAVRRIAYGSGRAVTDDCPWVGGTYTDYFVARYAPEPQCVAPPPRLPERFVDPTPELPGVPVFPGQPRPAYPGNPAPSTTSGTR